MVTFESINKPNSLIGVGLRHLHYNQALDNDNPLNQDIDFVEIHAENFFVEGGIKRKLLDEICDKYELSVHGTSLGLGSLLPLPDATLDKFCQLIEYTQASMISEHLCFNRAQVNGKVVHTGDLLPLAFNTQTLDAVCFNVSALQDRVKRPILIENLSAYLDMTSLQLKQEFNRNSGYDDFTELEFIHSLCDQTGCGLLVDINNMIVNEINYSNNSRKPTPFNTDHAYLNIVNKLKAIEPKFVGEIHLAGFSSQQVEGFVVDDHAQPVSELCWRLYEQALLHFGPVATLVEWDNNLPAWEVLTAEAKKASAIMKGHYPIKPVND